MKLFYQYLTIFFISSPTLSHFHPLQVENCDSNLRFVVGEEDNGKFRFERVNGVCNISIIYQTTIYPYLIIWAVFNIWFCTAYKYNTYWCLPLTYTKCNYSTDNVYGYAHHTHRSQALSHHTDHRPWGGWRRVGFAIVLQTACVNTSLTPISLLCAQGLAFSRNIFMHLKPAININIQLALK